MPPNIKFAISTLLIACLAACANAPMQQSGAARPVFVSSTPMKGFKTPESAFATKDGRIFVSEIGEFDKDGDGQISVIDSSGKVSVFAKGMNDPKGISYIGGYLYVADKTRVLKVASNGSWVVFAAANAFPVKPFFLNDIEPDLFGNIFVSDSGDIFNTHKGGAIYRIDPNGVVTTVTSNVQNPQIIAPNGMLMDNTGATMLEVDFDSGVLYNLNIITRDMIKLADGFGGGDGIALAKDNTLYISDWKNGKVYSLDKADEPKLLKSGFQSAADIALTPDDQYLLVPDMKAGELHWLKVGK